MVLFIDHYNNINNGWFKYCNLPFSIIEEFYIRYLLYIGGLKGEFR